MRELGDNGRAYIQAYKDWAEFEDLKRQNPDLADTYAESSAMAVDIMAIFENKGAAEEFAEAVQPIIDPYADDRSRIEKIRETNYYKEKRITDEDIQKRLDQLPPEPEQFSDEDRLYSTAYLVGRALSNHFTPSNVSTIPEADSSIVVPVPDLSGQPFEPEATGEKEPTPLHIKVYTKDNVMKINDTEILPLGRTLGIGKKSADDESFVEDFRLRAVMLLAENPDRSFVAKEIWESLLPQEIPFHSPSFRWYIGNFLINDYKFEGQPIVKTWKDTPEARLIHYQQSDNVTTFELVDEESNEDFTAVFKLPNNEIIAGRTGQMAHLLLAASEDEPVTLKTLVSKGIISKKELANLRKEGRAALSTYVSPLRIALKKADMAERFPVHRKDVPLRRPRKVTGPKRRQTINSESGYWMEDVSARPVGEEVDVELIDLSGLPETDTDPEVLEKILKTRVLADFMVDHYDFVQALGFKPLRQANIDQIKAERGESAELEVTSDDEVAVRIEALEAAKEMMNEANLETTLNNCPDGDPRVFTVLDFFFDNFYENNTVDHKLLESFEKALRSKVRGFVREPQEPFRTTGINYELADSNGQVVQIRPKYEEPTTDEIEDDIDPEDPNETDDQDASEPDNPAGAGHVNGGEAASNGKRLTNRERQQQALDQLRPKAVKTIKAAIKLIDEGGLDRPRIRPQHIFKVIPSLNASKPERLLGKEAVSDHHEFTVDEVVILCLAAQKDEPDVRRALGNKRQRAHIEGLVKTELDKHRRAKQKRTQAQANGSS